MNDLFKSNSKVIWKIKPIPSQFCIIEKQEHTTALRIGIVKFIN